MGDTPENNELDEYGVWVKTPLSQNEADTSDSSQEAADNDFGLPDFSFLDDIARSDERMAQESREEPEQIAPQEQEAPKEDSPEEEISFGDGEVDLSAFMTESPAPDGEIDVESFMSDSPSQGDGEVDLSDFLGGGDGEVSLDAFFGEGHTEAQEQEESVVDEDPLDIELTFDDDASSVEEEVDYGSSFEAKFNAPEQDSTGSTELDLDAFLSDDSPVDSMAETEKSIPEAKEQNVTEEISFDDFDTMFDQVQDESKSEAPDAQQETDNSFASTSGNEDIDLSEFGIEEDSDNQNVTLGKQASSAPVQRDYEMNVSIDDEPVSTTATETNQTSDDESISLEVEPEVHAEASNKKDTDFSAPDDDFDVDSLLNSVEDVNGTSTGISSETDSSSIESFISEENSAEPDAQEEVDVTNLFEDAQNNGTETKAATPLENGSEEEEALPPQNAEVSSTDSSAESEDDFNVDDLLNSVQDENGDVTSLAESTESESVSEEPYEEVPLQFVDITSEAVPQEEEPVRAATKNIPDEIPDTFDEEAASLTTESSEPTENSISGEPDMTESTSSESLEILKQISTELASLKTEIETLKTEFAELKEKPEQASRAAPETDTAFAEEPASHEETLAQTEEPVQEESEAEAKSVPFTEMTAEKSAEDLVREMNGETDAPEPQPADEGFFEGDDEDDTIALSGDELNNILNTAEFTEGAQEENSDDDSIFGSAESIAPLPDSDYESENVGLSMDFSNEQLEEPTFDSIPGEIEESGNEVERSLPEEISVPKVEDDLIVESSATNLMESEVENDSTEAFEIVAPTLDALNDGSLAQDEPEPLTEDNIDFLNSNVEEEDEELEAGISEQPVGAVFNQWENAGEPELEESTSEEETFPAANEPEEEEANTEDVFAPAEDEIFESEPTSTDAEPEFTEAEPTLTETETEVFETESSAQEEELVVPQVSDIEEAAQERNIPLAEESAESDDDDNEDDMSVFITGTANTILAAGLTEEQIAGAGNIAAEQSLSSEEPVPPSEEPVSSSEEPISSIEEPVSSSEEPASSSETPVVPSGAETFAAESEASQNAEPESAEGAKTSADANSIPADMKQEIKSVLAYMDQLLESLPEDKITEFAQSEQFVTYKKLFAEFGLA